MYLFIFWYTCLVLNYLSIHLFISVFIYLLIDFFVCLFVCLSICLYIKLFPWILFGARYNHFTSHV